MLRRTSRVAGFIEPCLPVTSQGAADRRRLAARARRDATNVRLYSRNGHNFGKRFSLIGAAVMTLPARSCLIDGDVRACGVRLDPAPARQCAGGAVGF